MWWIKIEVRGYFTLGCHSAIAIYLVSHFPPNLFERYPKLEIHLKHNISRRITEQVINLLIDIGIVVKAIQEIIKTIKEFHLIGRQNLI